MTQEPQDGAESPEQDQIVEAGQAPSDDQTSSQEEPNPAPGSRARLQQNLAAALPLDRLQREVAAAASDALGRMHREIAAAVSPQIEQMNRQIAASAALSWERINKQVADAAALPVQRLRAQIASLPLIYDAARIREQIDALLPRIDTAALLRAAERLQEFLPTNWPRSTRFRLLSEIAKDDGIPVVWVPRAEVLTDLAAAPDRAARVAILLGRVPDILDDCRRVLTEVTDADLLVRVPQALEAVDALQTGLAGAAQTLAVAVAESLLTEHVAQGRKYQRLADDVAVDTADISVQDVRSTFALLPVARFYTPWRPGSGSPPPEALSRHVTVHHARADHLTKENALIAVMLLASLLRDLDEARKS